MKRTLFVIGSVVAVLLIIIGVAPFLVPSSVYKTQIEKAATSALGRNVSVAGDVSVSIFPVISASVEDVTVDNPEGFEEPHMIDAGALRGSVRILPLFSRRVEVSKLSFEDANVRLTRLEDGRTNWMLGAGEDPSRSEDPDTSNNAFSASIDEAGLRNASLTYEDLQTGARYEVKQLDFETAFTAPNRPLSAKASGMFQDQAFSASLNLNTPEALMSQMEAIIDFEMNSDLANVRFDGKVTNSASISMTGEFSVTAPRVASIPEFLAISLPYDLGPLGSFQANGRISGEVPNLKIEFDKLNLLGDGLNVAYVGLVNIGDVITLGGTTDVSLRNVKKLSDEMGLNIDQLAPIQQLTINATVNGPAVSPSFTRIEARASSPTLTASYEGSADLAQVGKINGQVSAESSQLRTLLEQLGVAPPEGETLRKFKASGIIAGTFEEMTVSNGTFVLDDTTATGSAGIDLTGSRPRLVVDLDLGSMNLSPFLGSSDAPPPSDGWSDTPLDLAALQMLDATLQLKADRIEVGSINLSDAVMKTTLENGVLRADVDRFSSFGGNWQGDILVDGSGLVPSVQFKLGAGSIAAEQLLGTLAGFERLAGVGEFAVDVRADGASIQQIVNRLNGTISLNLDDGAIKGINLGQLVRSASSLTQSISTNNLDISSLGTLISPQAETDFSTFETSLSIKDGLAQIKSLELVNSVLDVTGAGQISLGGRTLDVNLTPAIDRTGQGNVSTVQLNGIPVPIKISGSWLSPQITPDFSGVRSALQAEARQRAGAAIGDQIGGELGTIVSGALGGTSAQQTKKPSASNTDGRNAVEDTESEPAAEDQDENEEDVRERVLKETLGSIFGPN